MGQLARFFLRYRTSGRHGRNSKKPLPLPPAAKLLTELLS